MLQLFKGKIGIADFTHLLQTGNLPEHGPWIFDALKLYESEGFDFSEQHGLYFIHAIIRTKTVHQGIEHLKVYDHRLPSWLNAHSFELLARNMPIEETPHLLESLEVLVQKGVVPRMEAFTLLFENLVQLVNNNTISFEVGRKGRKTLFKCAVKLFAPEQIMDLSEKYNHPVRPSKEAAEATASS